MSFNYKPLQNMVSRILNEDLRSAADAERERLADHVGTNWEGFSPRQLPVASFNAADAGYEPLQKHQHALDNPGDVNHVSGFYHKIDDEGNHHMVHVEDGNLTHTVVPQLRCEHGPCFQAQAGARQTAVINTFMNHLRGGHDD